MKNISLYIPNVVEPEPGYEAISIETEMALQTIPNGSCDEIIATDVLDCLDIKTRNIILELAIHKLAYNGTIIVCGKDILTLARNLLAQITSVDDANKYLYTNKKSTVCAETIISFFNVRGLKIIQKRLNDGEYSVVAQRIAPIVQPENNA